MKNTILEDNGDHYVVELRYNRKSHRMLVDCEDYNYVKQVVRLKQGIPHTSWYQDGRYTFMPLLEILHPDHHAELIKGPLDLRRGSVRLTQER